jgi:hypothetical protein
MSAFDEMLDALYASELGLDASYTPPGGGTAVPVRVMAAQQDQIGNFGQSRLQSERAVFKARRSELASPLAGGTLNVAGSDHTIKASPRSEDPRRLEWVLECAAPGG